jgi:hypothetical protein
MKAGIGLKDEIQHLDLDAFTGAIAGGDTDANRAELEQRQAAAAKIRARMKEAKGEVAALREASAQAKAGKLGFYATPLRNQQRRAMLALREELKQLPKDLARANKALRAFVSENSAELDAVADVDDESAESGGSERDSTDTEPHDDPVDPADDWQKDAISDRHGGWRNPAPASPRKDEAAAEGAAEGRASRHPRRHDDASGLGKGPFTKYLRMLRGETQWPTALDSENFNHSKYSDFMEIEFQPENIPLQSATFQAYVSISRFDTAPPLHDMISDYKHPLFPSFLGLAASYIKMGKIDDPRSLQLGQAAAIRNRITSASLITCTLVADRALERYNGKAQRRGY